MQAAFAEAIQNAKANTVRLTELKAEGMQDNGVDAFLRLKTVRADLAHVRAENARLRDDPDAVKKQLVDAVIAKLLKDVPQLQHERSGSNHSHKEWLLIVQKHSPVDDEVEELELHLSQTRIEDAAIPPESSIKQVEHLRISFIIKLYPCSLKTIKLKLHILF